MPTDGFARESLSSGTTAGWCPADTMSQRLLPTSTHPTLLRPMASNTKCRLGAMPQHLPHMAMMLLLHTSHHPAPPLALPRSTPRRQLGSPRSMRKRRLEQNHLPASAFNGRVPLTQHPRRSTRSSNHRQCCLYEGMVFRSAFQPLHSQALDWAAAGLEFGRTGTA